MRKGLALTLLLLLTLALSLAALGCGQRQEAGTEGSSGMTEQPMGESADTSMMSDTMMADTAMSH